MKISFYLRKVISPPEDKFTAVSMFSNVRPPYVISGYFKSIYFLLIVSKKKKKSRGKISLSDGANLENLEFRSVEENHQVATNKIVKKLSLHFTCLLT